jgi:hypothetical protein
MKNSNFKDSGCLHYFREDFIASVIKPIIDQLHDKKLSSRLNNVGFSNEKEKPIEKTLLDLLASQEGLVELRVRIGQLLGLNKEKVLSFRFKEEELVYILDQIFIESLETKICQIIDLFDHSLEKKLGWNELFLIIIYASSYESAQTCRFLHIFGQILFQSVSGAHDHLQIGKFKIFIKLLADKSLTEINCLLKKFDLS